MPADNTAVVSYPSRGADYHVQNASGTWVEQPLTNFGRMTSSFSETMNANSQTSAWAAYDIWLNGGKNEVMISHDFGINGACSAEANATFGGSYGVPLQNWELCQFGSELVWKLDSGNARERTGGVDILAMLTWLESHGFLPKNSTLGSLGYGWEICSTGGVRENFQVNGFSITTTSAGSAQPAAVNTSATTDVSATSATLNGSVNPEGQATTYQFDFGMTASHGSSVQSPPVSARGGTSAVNESYRLTGLQKGRTYHYRIEATNATGTSYGSDQMFTTPVNASGNVTYDATGPSRAGAMCANCTSLSWNHTVSGSSPAVLADVAVGQQGDTGLGVSVTDNGIPMTLLKTVHDDDNVDGFLDVFGLLNTPTGTNAISVGVGGGKPQEITGGSESFDNVAHFGNIASAYGKSGTASVASPESTSGGIMGGFVADGSPINSATGPSTSRYIVNEDQHTGAGNSAGATSPSTGNPVTMAWSNGNDYWGAIAVEAQPGSSSSGKATRR